MKKAGKIVDFTPYVEVKDKNGKVVVSRIDGLAVMKRTVVIDCGYVSENGDDIKDGYVCDMYRQMEDDALNKLKDSGEKVDAYISMDFHKSDDGRYFQKVTLHKVSQLTINS